MEKKAMMITVVLAIVTLVVGLVVGMVVEGTQRILYPVEEIEELEDRIDELEDELAAAKLTGPQKIGAILTMTGDLATYGANEKAAAELAISEVNDFLEAAGEEWTLELVVEDTACLPDQCLTKVESLHARGIDLLIGPLSSGELSNIMSYCNAEGILTISQSSTAPALAADDYVFRYCPNDLWQGRAVARLMWEDGTRYVIPTWRADAWGDGLEEQGEIRFEALGGEFSTDYVRYDVPHVDFSVEAGLLSDYVDDAIGAGYPLAEIAVWAISFEEIGAYMDACTAYPNLATVKWYGSDGTVNTPVLIDPLDPDVSAFAVNTEFINPIFSPLPATWKYDKVVDHINATFGRMPDSYSYNIYDMVWAYAYALMATHTYDAEAVKDVFPDVVKSMWGAAGWVDFDDNGDRKPTDYELWLVEEVGVLEYDWTLVGIWNLATDTITWL